MAAAAPTKSALVRRLEQYWRLELANAVLIPGTILVVAISLDISLGVPTLTGFAPMVVLLIIGGLYWRSKLHRLTAHPDTLRRLLPHLSRWQPISAALTLLALGVAAASWIAPAISAGTGDRIVGSICATLAALEYVNYYHRQLQHFDHRPDLARLRSGHGFRRSQMANDLRRWRATGR